MKSILVAAGMALVVAVLLTPVLIRTFSRLGLGQPIRAEAPKSHQRKQGTEPPWFCRRLGLLDSDQRLIGPVCIVEGGFELDWRNVAEVAV